MAEIIQKETAGGESSGRKKRKILSAHLDMTPMVDLMCLLITFFMLTTAFSKPKIIEITMPEDPGNGPRPPVPGFRVVNIVLSGDDKVYYYFGSLDSKEVPKPELSKTEYGDKGILKILLERNKIIFKKVEELKAKVTKGDIVISDSTLSNEIKKIKKHGDRNSPIVLIKADDKVKYKNIVDIIDEMSICSIPSYAIVPIDSRELKMIEDAK
jgi:biopolymer transport protein ExbD